MTLVLSTIPGAFYLLTVFFAKHGCTFPPPHKLPSFS